MALIYCSACGKQISDKAASCPHCGAVHTPLNTAVNAPVQPQIPVQQVAKSSNKVIITVGAILSVLIIALIVVVILMNNGGSSAQSGGDNDSIPAVTVTTPNNNYVPPAETTTNNAPAATDGNVPPSESVTAPAVAVYTVNLEIDCRENNFMNKYDVDILIDGKNLATLAHGASEVYALRLEEGSHSIEFRIASQDIFGDDIYDKKDTGTYQIKTFNVSKDTVLSYYVKLVTGNDIEVEIQ